ncbi:tRNA lysidine(34) synthetase TilS [Leucobacter iarius]|uniref:tRNA(Ile)-lysidine synthase n=1 Tax=Leucobacter iarius TaxID=333963 RepID=A0ABN2LBT3_9MICO
MTPRLPPLDPAVAEIRLALRRALGSGESAVARRSDVPLALVALSGGADSLALAAAAAHEARAGGHRFGAEVVDHGLQEGSADVAERAAGQARALGLDPVLVRPVDVDAADPDGPEAAARRARYAALEAAADETGAAAILTAHTRDDQAEQVLLGLSRGSGTRSIAGIPPRRGRILRPLLGVPRSSTEAACAAQGLDPWTDPQNADPAFARVRARISVLPVLERELGPGAAAALARSAEQAREDADALDGMVDECIEELVEFAEAGIAVLIPALAANPAAIRHRVIRRVARDEFGALLSRTHTLEIDRLITEWRGQGPLTVPGATVVRAGERLVFTAATPFEREQESHGRVPPRR